MPYGTGYFSVFKCDNPNCTKESCRLLTRWSPSLSYSPSYTCLSESEDSVLLSDGCDVRDPRTNLPMPMNVWCSHTGTVAQSIGFTTGSLALELPLDCELAPMCPESVLADSRLAQSCCYGSEHSHPYEEYGVNREEKAQPFCFNVSGTAVYFNGTISGGECVEGAVITSAPGWRGCACLDPYGYRGKVCTVDCKPPDCPMPKAGIKPTPDKWLTSVVSNQLQPGGQGIASTGSASLTMAVALQRVALLVLVASLHAAALPGRHL